MHHDHDMGVQTLMLHDFTMATLITIKSNHIMYQYTQMFDTKQAQIETLRSADFWAERERERDQRWSLSPGSGVCF